MEAGPEVPRSGEAGARERRWGRVLGVLGGALIVVATLMLAGAGYGTRVRRGFADRRSYDMVKPAVHRALPRATLTAALGLGLMMAGGRLRRAGSGSGAPRPAEARPDSAEDETSQARG